MIFLGTVTDAIGILIGSIIGVYISKWFKKSEKFSKLPDAIMKALGLCAIFIGIQGTIKGQNTLVTILSMALGTAIGELIDIDKRVSSLGNWAERRINRKSASAGEAAQGEGKEEETANGKGSQMAKAFVCTTLIFCVGSMAIVGALDSGLSNGANQEVLYAKTTLDFISAIVFASTLGIGTALSAISVLIYQGVIELFAIGIGQVITEYTINEISAVGSLLIIALGINIVANTKLKIANMIPSVFLPLLFCLFLK